MAEPIDIIEDTILMCRDCWKSSGSGKEVPMTYGRFGDGWSPKWEGRVCLHITKADLEKYFRR